MAKTTTTGRVFLRLSKHSEIIIMVLLLTSALVVLSGISCSSTPAIGEKLPVYTGGTSGTYYPLGQALAGLINGKVEGVEASAVSSGGSVDNAGKIATGEAGLALIQNDIADYAYHGAQMFAGSPVNNIRGIASWYPETVQFVTLKEFNIKAIGDLKGRRVAVGAPGSGVKVEAMAILDAAGITPQNTNILEMDFKEVAQALLDKTIEAGCIVAGFPTPAVSQIAGSREIYILEITGDIYNTLREQCPFFIRQAIPAGAYNGLDQEIQTVAVLSMLVTRAEIQEVTIYHITRAMFENLDVLAAAHVRGGDIHLNTAMAGMTVPLHPGALRYYREQGLIH
jgi:uncharacterized protein